MNLPMDNQPYLPEVRHQYETYPFPPRIPEQERSRLVDGLIDHAALVNHYGFGGKQSFNNSRVLIAGGGTGDATIFWAEQLRERNGEVVHVDISATSIEIAQQRAAERKLDNIHWQQQSLLELSPDELGTFEFINCHGVLHHLEDPLAGLRSLHRMLKSDGCMGLLLYGKYGRLALYQVQELLRRCGIQQLEVDKRIELARQLMEQLPACSWYRRGPHSNAHRVLPDAVFFDSYLHSQDRAYTVPELHELIDAGGFHFVEFCNPAYRVLYRPETFIQDRQLRDRLPNDERQRQAIAELMGGQIDRHEFYVAKQPETTASIRDLRNVPFFFPSPVEGLPEAIASAGNGRVVDVDRGNGLRARFRPRKYTETILRFVDGARSLAEIFSAVRQQTSSRATDQELLDDFQPTYAVLNRLDILLLRHESVLAFPSGGELQARTFG